MRDMSVARARSRAPRLSASFSHPLAILLASVAALSPTAAVAQGTPDTSDAAPPEIRVISSPGFAAAAKILGDMFAQEHGVRVVTERVPSTGLARRRVEEGEPADIVILGVDAMDALVDGGFVLDPTRTGIGSTGVGLAVPNGSPVPDVSSLDALRRVLLNARSVAYSSGPSGSHVADVVLPRLGIEAEVTAKSVRTSAVPGALMAGDADVGFQQMSELIPIEGIQYVGPLPVEVQNRTPYDAAVVAASAHPELARALLAYFLSSDADPVVVRMGLER